MDLEQDDGKTRSRFAKHLQLLDLEASPGLSPEELEAERRLMARMPLPPLPAARGAKPRARRSWLGSRLFSWQLAVGALAAASLAVVVYRGMETDVGPGWRVKGGIVVDVHTEKDGKVTRFEPGRTLDNGTRVRVDVRAPAAARAYLVVRTRAGVAESAIREAIANSLALAPNESRALPGSFELEGDDEDESLVVLVCPADHAAGVSADTLAAELLGTVRGTAKGAFQACRIESVQLR